MTEWFATKHRRPAGIFCLACLPLVLLGCGEGSAASSGVVVTDSAGVVLVEVGSLSTVLAPPASLELVFNTSTTGIELFRVSSARVLEDGRIVVGNAGNQQVLLLGPSGRLSRTVGRSGDGPGEFRTITTLHRSEGGGFAVYDTRSGRWSRFDAVGDLVSTASMSPPNSYTDLKPLSIGPEGQVIGIYGSLRRLPAEGIQRDTTPLLMYQTPGTEPDTLSLWATRETLFERAENSWSSTDVGFGRSLAEFGADQFLVLGDTDRLDILLMTIPGRSVMKIRGGGAGIVTAESDGEQWRRDKVANLRSDLPTDLLARFTERLSRAPFRESYPAFDKLAVDVVGRVWIGTSMRYGDSERQWVVFGTDGSPSATLNIPADAEVLDITETQLLTSSRDDFGVESLSVWAIMWPE